MNTVGLIREAPPIKAGELAMECGTVDVFNVDVNASPAALCASCRSPESDVM